MIGTLLCTVIKKSLLVSLSSILSFIGMAIGIILGNVESMSVWIFSATAGVFLYVSLVDLVRKIKGITAKMALN